MAEEDGDAAAVEQIDQQLQQYLKAELSTKVDSVRNYIREQENAARIYGAEAEDLRYKAQRAIAAADRVKAFVLGLMQAFEIQKYRGELHWIRRQKNGGVVPVEIVQPDLVPEKYQRISVTVPLLWWRSVGLPPRWSELVPEPDPAAIRAALEAGEGVPGCRLQTRGEHLRMD